MSNLANENVVSDSGGFNINEVIGYNIWRNDDTEWEEIVADTETTDTNFVDTSSLNEGKQYWYAVRSISKSGFGEWSKVTSTIVKDSFASSSPRRFVVESHEEGVSMSWELPTN